jgi:hypothetical protein
VRPLPHERPPVFGDGHAADRIALLCLAHLTGTAEEEAQIA